jgi:hypothetical protein
MAFTGGEVDIIPYNSVCKNYFAFFLLLVKTPPVGKKRSDGQVLMAFALDEKLVEEIDAKRGALSRSAFIRVALVRLLGLSDEAARPPVREGLSKGGKPTHKSQSVALATSSEVPYHVEPHTSKRKKA